MLRLCDSAHIAALQGTAALCTALRWCYSTSSVAAERRSAARAWQRDAQHRRTLQRCVGAAPRIVQHCRLPQRDAGATPPIALHSKPPQRCATATQRIAPHHRLPQRRAGAAPPVALHRRPPQRCAGTTPPRIAPPRRSQQRSALRHHASSPSRYSPAFYLRPASSDRTEHRAACRSSFDPGFVM